MGQSIRYAGACPNCSRAMFATVLPPVETVKCYGCGAIWKSPTDMATGHQGVIEYPPISSLDAKVESLLQAADEHLATPVSMVNHEGSH